MVRRYDTKTVIAILATSIAGIALLLFGGWYVYTQTTLLANAPIVGTAQDTNKVIVKNVSSDTMERLSEGSVITFGDPEKPHVTLIVDPSELSREKKLVNGEPSALLNAVKDNQIFLNLYLVPNDESRTQGTNSLIRAATCNLANDKSSGAVVTLVKLANAAPNFVGDEDILAASEILKIPADIQCPDTVGEASAGTADNGRFFAQHFGIQQPSILVSDGQLVNTLDKFKSDWVQDLIAQTPASGLLDSSADIEFQQ